jgi:hypothetical protein
MPTIVAITGHRAGVEDVVAAAAEGLAAGTGNGRRARTAALAD